MRHLALSLAAAMAGCTVSFPASRPAPAPEISLDGGGVDTSPGTDAGTEVTVLASVIDVEGTAMVVLSETPDPAWGVGLARALGDGSDRWDYQLIALRDVDAQALPEDVRARARSDWQLYGRRTECRARLGVPVLVRRGSSDAYGDEAADDTVPLADRSSVAARLWSLGLEVLAAPVVAIDGDCDGARFALPAPTRVTHVFRDAGEVDPALDHEARAAFVDTAAYQALQVEYDQFVAAHEISAEVGAWPASFGADMTTVCVLRAPGANDLVLVQTAVNSECSGFYGSLFAVFERRPDGLLLVDHGSAEGAPELVVDRGGRRSYVASERWRDAGDHDDAGRPTWHDMRMPWFGCAC